MNQKEIEEVYSTTYFKINEVLLITAGLWPFRSRNENLLRRIIVIFTLVALLFPTANAVRIWCGVDFCLCGENIVGCLYSLVILLKYYVTIISESKILKVHEQVAKYWINITDAAERSILRDYAIRGKTMSVGYVAYMTLAGLAFSQATIIPVLLDLIFPLNESRQKILIVKAEYFIDPFEYYYQLYIGYCIGSTISVMVLMSIDTTFSAVVHQNLGILSIIKHRLQIATKFHNENNDVAYKLIIKTIHLHKSALQFLDLIEASYNVTFLIIIGCSIVSLSLGLILTLEYLGEPLELVRMTMMEIGIFIHILYLSYPGQQILDHSSDIFLYIYMNEWYFISEKAKSLLRIMMIRCVKPSILTAGKFYVMNYENFGIVIKTTLSYIAVLASLKN